MSRVAASISVSLDGFVAGPDDGPEVPMGVGGERLHEWVFGLANWRERHGLEGGENNVDAEVLEEGLRNLGAVVVGRRMFDNAGGWGDEPPFRVPVFVLTHEARNELVKGETTFTFVNEGIESAVGRARAAAGQKDVSIGGGASTIRQSIAAGLLDELQLHLVPILLGGGVRLFDDALTTELERTRVIDSPAVTHLRFRVARP
jgi:dihydrofolate reductase